MGNGSEQARAEEAKRRERFPKASICLFHNIIAPYRLPIFERIHNQAGDLEVLFARTKTKERSWDTSLIDKYSFSYKVLPSIAIGRLVTNPTMIFELLRKRRGTYVVNENPSDALSVLMTLLVARVQGTPTVLWTEHIDSDFMLRSRGRLLRFLLELYWQFVYALADVFVAYSRMAKEFLIRRGVDPGRVIVGTQVMPSECMLEGADSGALPEPENKRMILYVGHLRMRKGLGFLIDAFKRINASDTMLVLAGHGEGAEELKRLAGVSKNIVFTGYVSGNIKRRIFENAHIFVLPTLHDAWGLVTNEAMSFGLPIVITSAAGSSELIDGNGIVVPPGDEKALADAMLRLLTEKGLSERMGAKSRELAKRLDVTIGAQSFIDAIEQAWRLTSLRTSGRMP